MISTLRLLTIWIVVLVSLTLAQAQRRSSGNTRDGGSSQAPTQPAPSQDNSARAVTPRPEQSSSGSSTTSGGGGWLPSGSIVAAPTIIVVPTVVEAGVTIDGPNAPAGESYLWEFELWDIHASPARAGFDFSEPSVCPGDDEEVDVIFEMTRDDAVITVQHDTDIRDLGWSVGAGSDEVTATKEWSPSHSVKLVTGHAYLVWTWDDQFFRFVVEGVSRATVRCSWTPVDEETHYQTRAAERIGTSRPVFVRTKFPR